MHTCLNGLNGLVSGVARRIRLTQLYIDTLAPILVLSNFSFKVHFSRYVKLSFIVFRRCKDVGAITWLPIYQSKHFAFANVQKAECFQLYNSTVGNGEGFILRGIKFPIYKP